MDGTGAPLEPGGEPRFVAVRQKVPKPDVHLIHAGGQLSRNMCRKH